MAREARAVPRIELLIHASLPKKLMQTLKWLPRQHPNPQQNSFNTGAK
jgi:hypothetical protein